jgi:predicted secreted Zn-dependent protease
MEQYASLDEDLGDEHYAYTRYSFEYRYARMSNAQSCTMTSSSVAVSIAMTLPQWDDYASASAPMRAEWDRFITQLTLHEQGHVDIVHRNEGRVRAAFDGIRTRPDCAALDSEIKKISLCFEQLEHQLDLGCIALLCFWIRRRHSMLIVLG